MLKSSNPDGVQPNLDKSFFASSALRNVIIDSSVDFKQAVAVFRRESERALSFDRDNSGLFGALSREQYKTFILKALLFIGISADGHGLAVLARLIEILTLNPAISPDEAIEQFAKTCSASFGAVERIVEKHFNVYNEQLVSRVTLLTQSRPMTPKDVLCDLSVYVRMNFLQEIKI